MKPIILTRRLPHPVERVWCAVTDAAELADWMPGGAPWPDGTVFEPPHHVAFETEAIGFRIDLEPDGDGTLLTFTHRFADGPRDQHAHGWEVYFTRLDALLAGTPLGEQEAHDTRRLTLTEGPRLRLERRFYVGVDRLWRALTEPAELAGWFPGTYEVVERDAPRRLVVSWNEGTLRFDLESDGAATRLTFTHEFGDHDQAALAAAGWDRCFARLEAMVGGRPMDEATSLELWPYVHDRYAERFGIDPEIGRRAYGEHSAS